MVNVLRVNGEWLPTPEGDLSFKDTKIMTEKESEAGTTLALVTRLSKLTIAGKWHLSGIWAERFRALRNEDTVMVEAYYPDRNQLTERECFFKITGETHLVNARKQLMHEGGLYEVEVEIEEL